MTNEEKENKGETLINSAKSGSTTKNEKINQSGFRKII